MNDLKHKTVTFKAFSICLNWPPRLVNLKTECTNLKDKFYPGPSNFFKIARIIFGVKIFQDFAAPSLQNDAFDLQIGPPDRPVPENGKHS